jgi:hypothetical protein
MVQQPSFQVEAGLNALGSFGVSRLDGLTARMSSPGVADSRGQRALRLDSLFVPKPMKNGH